MLSSNGEISLPLQATAYASIPSRGEKAQLDAVRRELGRVINALPTQIRPEERQAYLDAILSDLEPVSGAVWTTWPEDVHLLALTSIKNLGRNPVGSETLLSDAHLFTINYHTSLPFPSPSVSTSPAVAPPHHQSPAAFEALRVVANLLVLHPAGRRKYAAANGGVAIARALAGRLVASSSDGVDGEGRMGSEGGGEEGEETVDRLFLLGRIGFLVAMEGKNVVNAMVDEGAVESLVYHLSTTPVVPSNYNAISELLKLTHSLISFYPFPPSPSSTSSTSPSDPWSDRFDPLLYPLLTIFYLLPFTSLLPPLTHTIHALVGIPFNTSLLPTWHTLPDTQRRSSSSSTSSKSSTPTPAGSPHSPNQGGSSPVRALISKISHMTTGSSGSHPRKSSADAGTGSGSGASLAPPRAVSPSPLPSPVISTSAGATGNKIGSTRRRAPSPFPSYNDPTAFPDRMLAILTDFFTTYLPDSKGPDEAGLSGQQLDDQIPPVLLVLTRAAKGSPEIREHLKKRLLPLSLDRSADAGPLESRKGLLGDILRLMGSTHHFQARDTAGELMWAICNEDATDLCVEIGYGNAAGLLFRKGISGPPPAKIEAIDDQESGSASSSATTLRHPITALYQEIPGVDAGSAPATSSASVLSTSSASASASTSIPHLAEMTQEEKEREAERLFVLFDRLEKNPILSAGAKGSDGSDKPTNMVDVMRSKMETGEVERWDREEEERGEREREEEERKEEEEVGREMEAYRKRMGR